MVEVQIDAVGMAILARTETNFRVYRRERYRAGGIRTRDLLHPRQALYQAEPQPELIAVSSEIKRGARIYFAYSGRGGKVE
jgi:outer membrane protein TolC